MWTVVTRNKLKQLEANYLSPLPPGALLPPGSGMADAANALNAFSACF
jgi:hypothetical protein